MKTTLVIMAAGIGSRFGGGIKQLEPVGPNGEIIMDYSIKDAMAAGFNKVVFIIRKDLEKDFKEVIGNRIEKLVEVDYAYQELDDLPAGFTKPEQRKKPWGTGQAILVCKDIVKEPFIVINADDYYGKEAYVKLHDFLCATPDTVDGKLNCGMAGFVLSNTLSENGTVTRGICQVDEKARLTKVVETSGLQKDKTTNQVTDNQGQTVPDNALVSMNMWALRPEFIEFLHNGFKQFLGQLQEGDITSEYLLPTIIDDFINQGMIQVTMMDTNDRWYGITYKEDKAYVANAFKSMR